MKKIIIPMLLLAALALSGCTQLSSAPSAGTADNLPMSSAETAAEKLEVYYFHRTARCYSCNALAQRTSSLINERYSRQVRDGKIDFRQLNVELPENKEIARKFKASGSSLFINRITGGQDNIEQDVNVWRLLNNEASFNKYLGDKIDSYLSL